MRILSSTMFSINKVLENLNMEASCYLNGRQTCRRTHRRRGAGEEAQELEHWCAVGGKVKWCSHDGKPHGGSSKELDIELLYDPAT